MNLPAFAVKYLRKLLNYPLGGLSITPEEAKEGLRLLGTKKRSDKATAFKGALRARAAQKKAAHRESTRTIRAAVMGRAGEDCELCGHHMESFGPPHMHHLSGGSGQRRQRQAVSNCIALCRVCHQHIHASPLGFLTPVKAWAAKHGYPVPSRFEALEWGMLNPTPEPECPKETA